MSGRAKRFSSFGFGLGPNQNGLLIFPPSKTTAICPQTFGFRGYGTPQIRPFPFFLPRALLPSRQWHAAFSPSFGNAYIPPMPLHAAIKHGKNGAQGCASSPSRFTDIAQRGRCLHGNRHFQSAPRRTRWSVETTIARQCMRHLGFLTRDILKKRESVSPNSHKRLPVRRGVFESLRRVRVRRIWGENDF